MSPGMIIAYRVRPIPRVPVDWVTEITHVREPSCSSTSSGSGHTGSGTTSTISGRSKGGEMVDLVHYALLLGWVGRVFGGLLVRRRLAEIFAFRRRFLEREFGAGGRG